MLVPMIEKDFGPDAAQLSMNIKLSPYENVSMGLRQMNQQMSQQVEQLKSPEGQQYMQSNPDAKDQLEKLEKQQKCVENAVKLFDYLESADNKPATNMMPAQGQPY